MKVTRFLIAVLALLAVTLMFASCSNDDGKKKETSGCMHENLEGTKCLDCSLETNPDDFVFEKAKAGDYYKLIAYMGGETDIILPATYNGYPVTEIGREAFRFSGVKKVTIPEGYVTIGARAFHTSVVLEHVSFPSTLTTIGERAFAYCNEIDEFTIPGTVTIVSEALFEKCETLRKVTIEEGVTVIETQAFAGCTKLEEIIIPTSVVSIRSGALAGVKKVSGIKFPEVELEEGETPRYVVVNECLIDTTTKTVIAGCAESQIPADETVTAIGELAFSGSDIASITIPENIVTIGPGAFSYCLKLESATLPPFITVIPEELFYNATALESIVIPEGVTTIEAYAFYYCTSLESVTFPQETLEKIGESAFQECTALEEIIMPHTVTEIGENIFHGCKNLDTVEFSVAITVIPKGTFVNCKSLRSIKLAGMISTIERYAFKGCTALQSVVLSAKLEIIEENAFNDCSSLVTLYYGGTEKTWGKVEMGQSYIETKDENGNPTSKVVLEGYEVVYNYIG